MGGTLSSKSGIDSIGSVDTTINQVLFPAPATHPDKIRSLAKLPYTTLDTVVSESGINVSVLTIVPESMEYKKTVIWSHGNGCDVYTSYDYLHQFCNDFGVRVVCYDYPGYGLTPGKADEESCVECLATVVETVADTDPYADTVVVDKDMLLVGQSLGTGVVINHITGRGAGWRSPVILISPYKSIPRVLTDTSAVESCVSKYRFATHSKISAVKCPVKIFHGERDTLIDIAHARDLYDALPDKTLGPVWIPDADHNDILGKIDDDDIWEVLHYEPTRSATSVKN